MKKYQPKKMTLIDNQGNETVTNEFSLSGKYKLLCCMLAIIIGILARNVAVLNRNNMILEQQLQEAKAKTAELKDIMGELTEKQAKVEQLVYTTLKEIEE